MSTSCNGLVSVSIPPVWLETLIDCLEGQGYHVFSADETSLGKYILSFPRTTDFQDLEKTLEHLVGGGFLRKVEFLPS